tara:strand:- start:1309 stop:1659 length:351 start_codon:yes stop_codon:yes gene_type:complete
VKHIKHSDSRKGDLAEYYAVTWLWDNGYEVFKNTGCTGLVDMIALKDSEVTLIDVKTFCLKLDRKSSSFSTGIGLVPSNPRTEEQKKLGVKILGFNPKTRELKFVEHPDETENKKS